MTPRRSGRRSVRAYKKGDYIEYQYKGSTVTGKLIKKSPSSITAHPIWVITPTDRRRKNEEIPEKALGKIIDAEEAMNNRGPKIKRTNGRDNVPTESASPTLGNSNIDGSLDQPHQAPKRGTTRKRKGEESTNNGCIKRAKKIKNTVNFSQESDTISKRKPKKKPNMKARKAVSTRIGTRSTPGPDEVMSLLANHHPGKSAFRPTKRKIVKDENVTMVKMLTGTLYLYRGDRPRVPVSRR